MGKSTEPQCSFDWRANNRKCGGGRKSVFDGFRKLSNVNGFRKSVFGDTAAQKAIQKIVGQAVSQNKCFKIMGHGSWKFTVLSQH